MTITINKNPVNNEIQISSKIKKKKFRNVKEEKKYNL